MRSRVIPGSSPTMARREPISRLKSVDLPTLGRPTMATVGMRSFKLSCMIGARYLVLGSWDFAKSLSNGFSGAFGTKYQVPNTNYQRPFLVLSYYSITLAMASASQPDTAQTRRQPT